MDTPEEITIETYTEPIDNTTSETYTETIQQQGEDILQTLTTQNTLISFQIALLFVVIFAIVWGNR